MPARYRVALTRGAEADLETLYDYLAEHRSPEQAQALLDALLERIETLEHYPERGAAPQELAALGINEFRQLSMPPYRLVYQVVVRTVYVTLIADGRRNVQALLSQRLLHP